MKLLLTSFLFTLSFLAYSQNIDDSSFRIMTYNIRNSIGMDMKTDYKRTADVIDKWHPDIVAIQEIDSVTNRSSNNFVIQNIANLCDMNYSFAPAISYDGGKYGIGILSREKPLNTYYLPLPGREEKRVLLVAEFDKFVFMCVHLSLTPDDQVASLEQINNEVEKFNKSVFIAGDFNAEPESETILKLVSTFKILSPMGAKTYPADDPVESIDYIAIDTKSVTSYKAKDAFVVDEPLASDHKPLIVDIQAY